MISAAELVAKIKSYNPSVDSALIYKAYVFSKTGHGNQKRHSGDPYFSHPLAVAEIIVDLKLDNAAIIAALFHDLVEDTEITLDDIAKDFGEQVSMLVDGVTELEKIEAIVAKEREAEDFRKLTLAMSKDIRVLIIKLADRLHNMRTIFYMPSKEKRIKKARETLEIYAPLAGRIGLNKIKDELQDLAFAVIDPETRNFIITRLRELREEKKDYIEKIITILNEKLLQEKIKCKIFGREKTPYSIWIKMKSQNVGFHNLHDIMAFRIIVKNIGECYRVLGIVNSSYSMIPSTFRDYISTPKDNGYQSLHLAILGPFNKKIELQIRDKKMHEISELGVASHWIYKDHDVKKNQDEAKYYQWARDLVALFENSDHSIDALQQTKLQINKNEIFCFSKNGHIFNLPFGATVIDFAYAIHSEIGNGCVSAKVNSVIAPLRQRLENGDQVEIITAKNAKPSPNWLQFAMTAKAKSAIKNFTKREKHDEHKNLGRAILQKFFNAKALEINEQMLEKILKIFQVKNVDDLYVRVAEGRVTRQDVLVKLYPNYQEEKLINSSTVKNSTGAKKQDEQLLIDGLIAGMAMHYAGCCNPIPGDAIVGVINTGTGVAIHNQFCHNLKNIALNPQRIIDVAWKIDVDQDKFFTSKISVIVENESGSLAEITNVIARQKINITNIKIINRNIDYFELLIEIEVNNKNHLEELLSALKILRKVSDAKKFMS